MGIHKESCKCPRSCNKFSWLVSIYAHALILLRASWLKILVIKSHITPTCPATVIVADFIGAILVLLACKYSILLSFLFLISFPNQYHFGSGRNIHHLALNACIMFISCRHDNHTQGALIALFHTTKFHWWPTSSLDLLLPLPCWKMTWWMSWPVRCVFHLIQPPF